MSDIEEKQEDVETKVEEKQTEVVLSADEQSAVSKGWKPKDKWVEDGGNEDDWKPAKVFNEIGSLKDKLVEREKDNKKLNKVVALMKEHHLQVRETAVQEALKTLKAQRQAALKEENFAQAEAVRDKMDELKETASKGASLPPEIEKEIKAAEANEPPPEFYQFLDRNPWYKPNSNDGMSKKADTLGYAYHVENPDWNYEQIIKAVEVDIRKLYPDKFETPKGGPNDNGSRDGGSGKATSKVRLSEEQRNMAREFGMTDEAYAEELKSYKGN